VVVLAEIVMFSLALSVPVPLSALFVVVAFRAAVARLGLAVAVAADRVAVLALVFALALLDLTIVVVTLLLLASLCRESCSTTVAEMFRDATCRLAARAAAAVGLLAFRDVAMVVVLLSLAGMSDLIGERGIVRELCDLGERTAVGPPLRETVREAFVLAVATAAVVFARFFGFASSCMLGMG
jgi:hypothetical protein